MKIGFIIPCTSRGRNWKHMNETYLYNLTLKTFLLYQDKEHEYHFYLGVDNDDPIFNNATEQNIVRRFTNIFKNIHIHFVVLNIPLRFAGVPANTGDYFCSSSRWRVDFAPRILGN